MKIFQNLVKLIVLSIFALPVLLYGVSGTLTEKVPSKTVKLHDSLVKGSSKSVPGEFRSLEAIVMDQVTDSYGGGTGTLWIRGGLMISGIQIINEVGSFEGFVGGTAQKKATGKGKGEPKKWNFNLTGTYNINKCTNSYVAPEIKNVEWDPLDCNLTEWNKSANVRNTPFDFPVTSNSTWTDLAEGIPGKWYGQFVAPNPQPRFAESQNKKTECPVCRTNNFLHDEYFLDWNFFSTKIEIHVWTQSKNAGPQTKQQWDVCLAETIKHENKHRDDFKRCVLDVVKPLKYHINVCNNCSPEIFANVKNIIKEKNEKMLENAMSVLATAHQARINAAADHDKNDVYTRMSGDTILIF